jgi:hypothetical protein
MRRARVAATAVVVMAGVGIAIAVETTPEASEVALPAWSGSVEALASLVETWGFEPDEGFSTGFVGGQAGWIAINGTAEAHVDTMHPHTGTQHLRITFDPEFPPGGAYTGARSPTVPDTVADTSSLSMWVAIGATGGADYEIALIARQQGLSTARVYFDDSGDIRVLDHDSNIVDTGFDWTPGGYVRLEIRVDPVDEAIDYHYGGNLVFTSGLLAGKVIEDVMLLSDNSQNGEHADFDDLIIERGRLGPLLHRWSFTTDGTDSVGGADAVLRNGASVSGGALVLDGVDDYAQLPILDTLRVLTDVSVEMWVTWTGWRSWERFFDFGDNTNINWFMTPSASQTGKPRVAITVTGNPGEQRTDAPEPFPQGARTHVVYTLDGDGPSDQSKLYVDGSLVAVHHEDSPLDPAEIGPLVNDYLGKSQYAEDPYFTGAIDEFIIYSTVLTDLEVLEHYRAIFADGFDGGDTSAWSGKVP